MHNLNETRQLTSSELMDVSREETKNELTEEELSKVSGGKGSSSLFKNCCSGEHFKEVTLHC
jgi:bacteriocin-like protein